MAAGTVATSNLRRFGDIHYYIHCDRHSISEPLGPPGRESDNYSTSPDSLLCESGGNRANFNSLTLIERDFFAQRWIIIRIQYPPAGEILASTLGLCVLPHIGDFSSNSSTSISFEKLTTTMEYGVAGSIVSEFGEMVK